MPSTKKVPIGNKGLSPDTVVRHTQTLGALVSAQRKRLALTQLDLAGLANTGNRFIVDVENGKPTVQLQKVLELLELLGLELVLRPKAAVGKS